MRTCLLLILAVLSWYPVLSAPQPAHAQSSSGQRKANRHFKNGVALFEEGKHAEALAEFERAYELAPHPLVLYNLAVAHRALSHYADAVNYFERFLEEGNGKVNRDKLQKGKQELADLMRLLAFVAVDTSPTGATIKVDGMVVGTTPLAKPLAIGPGQHRLEAELDGHLPQMRELRLAAGDKVKLVLGLKPEPAADASAAGNDAGTIDDGSGSDLEVSASAAESPRQRHLVFTAGGGTNARIIDESGAPMVGVGYAINDRFALNVDVVLIAYSAVPSLRVRLVGERVALHAVAAVPISFTDGGDSDLFVAGAAGISLRARATEMFALRLDGLVSYAGSDRGFSIPLLAGGEVWF